MKRNILEKMAAAMAVTVTLACGFATTASAAEGTHKETEREGLAGYRQEMDENLGTLQILIHENQQFITKLVITQKEWKETGALTEAIQLELQEMSERIREQRVLLAEQRELAAELQEIGRENMKAGDTNAAEEAVRQALELQQEQIQTRNGLQELLEEKLALLQ